MADSRTANRVPVRIPRRLILLLVLPVLSDACAPGPVDYARPYPVDKGSVRTLDVQVFRFDDRIRLTNTSPVEFGTATIWINAAYSRPLEGLRIGQTVELPLLEFRNEHSQAFRAGGFFATDLPSRLVLAEIEDERGLFGLIVVEDRAN